MHNSTVARLDALTRALGASTILALLLAPNASAQQAAELFTAGTVIADEHTRFESLHDINGDGILDAVGWYWMQSTLDTIRASVTLFDGEGGVIDHLTAISPVAGNNVNREGASGSCVGDFDGDGRLEQIVYLYDTFFHMEFDPSGSITFLPNFAHPNPAWHGPSWSYKNLVAADFDGDGVDDFIAVGTHEIELWTVDASGGTLLDAISFGPNHWRTTVDKGDFNGDGQADIAVSFVDGAGNFVRIYPMAAGSFGVPIEVALDDRGGPIDLTTWDADGDGDDDLMLMGTTFPVVWPAAWDDTSRVIEQTAPGVFVPWPRQVDSGPSTSLADVNGDGHLDGICCGGSGTPYTLLNNEPSEFMVCLGDGLGGFDHAVPFQGLGAQHIAGAMDFDGDGDMDLVAGRVVLLNTQAVASLECTSSLNSRGLPAVIHALGSASIGRNDLVVHTRNLPPGQPALTFFGPSANFAPLFDGMLCVGGQIQRLPVQFADATGRVSAPLDFGASTTSGLAPGDVIRVQTWYRDPGFGRHANLSYAGRIMLMP